MRKPEITLIIIGIINIIAFVLVIIFLTTHYKKDTCTTLSSGMTETAEVDNFMAYCLEKLK